MRHYPTLAPFDRDRPSLAIVERGEINDEGLEASERQNNGGAKETQINGANRQEGDRR